MGVWKVTYVAGSSTVPFCCNKPRLGREPLVVPFVFFNDIGDTISIEGGKGVTTAVLVGVNTNVFVGAMVGEPIAIAVGVLDGGTEVEVKTGADVRVLVGTLTVVDVLVGTLPSVGVFVGVSLITGTLVGVKVASVPVGVKVTAGVAVGVLVETETAFSASPRAITSTSPNPAADPFTELNWMRTTRVSTSLKLTFVPVSVNAPEFLFAASTVPAASLNKRTVASSTLTEELELAGLYKRTVRTVTGTGKVNCTHCVLGLPDWLTQYFGALPFGKFILTRRSLIPLLEPPPVEETVTNAPVARFVHCASAGLDGTLIMV